MSNTVRKIENIKNRTGGTPSSTGYKGVTFDARRVKNYQARIVITNGRNNKPYTVSLGYYTTPEEAYIVRCKYLDSLK